MFYMSQESFASRSYLLSIIIPKCLNIKNMLIKQKQLIVFKDLQTSLATPLCPAVYYTNVHNIIKPKRKSQYADAIALVFLEI